MQNKFRIHLKRMTVFIIVSLLGMIFICYGKTSFALEKSLNTEVNLVQNVDNLITGDVNGDGDVDSIDLTRMRKYLLNSQIDINTVAADLNGDGEINSIDLTRLRKLILNGPEEPEAKTYLNYDILESKLNNYTINTISFKYGESSQGRDLVCFSIEPENYEKTILLNFEIHGWEDNYAKDGQLLVDLGNSLVEYYSDSQDMQNCRVMIIPSCNPDGLAEGTTKNGFGRCNAEGIDLNRDFDISHQIYTDSRNKSLYPFSAVESRAMRDLVLACKPNIVIDFHGWEKSLIGSGDVAEVFSRHCDLHHKTEFHSGAHGYFSYWAQSQGAEGLLVEFAGPTSIETEKVIEAINDLISDDYGHNKSDVQLDPDFEDLMPISTYTLSSDRYYTHANIGETGTSYGYVDGSSDLCSIIQAYENGWCKVRYPLSNGFIKTGYCLFSAFVDEGTRVEPYSGKVNETTKVYRTSSMSETIGSVWSTDIFTVVSQKDGLEQIVYPLDEGGYKMGWIYMQ